METQGAFQGLHSQPQASPRRQCCQLKEKKRIKRRKILQDVELKAKRNTYSFEAKAMKIAAFFASLLEKYYIMLYSVAYMESAKATPSAFTRRRKMSFVQYILFILQKTGRSLQAGLNTFFVSMGEEPGSYSRQAFSQGRLRIRPEAILELFTFGVKEFYAGVEYRTFDGYRVLAIDGTKLNLPNTDELEQEFGVQRTSGAPQVQALVSGMYDILNGIMVDVRISPCKKNERTHAAELIGSLREQPVQKNLIVMDRGYPSAELLHLLESEGHSYVVRCSSEFTVGMKLRGNDCIVEHRFSCMKQHPLKIRVVKLPLPDGKVEILATNLFDKSFSISKLAQIYRMRWEIETNFNNIKNRLCVENFTGTNRIVILQDFYATMMLWNLAAILMYEMKDDIEVLHQSDINKNEYHLNVSMTISTLKEHVVEMVACGSKRKIARILRQIHKALYRSVVVFRPDRSFPRRRKHLALKFHNNSKFI